jgi:2-polyprenyl-3-methyl-5-hydroxy-6-metoxy-1,4-benzoquinol methylase
VSKTRHYNAGYERLNPWEIGRPQKEVVHLGEAGEIKGRVLDVGCGSGENTLYLAALGCEVLGVDASSTAIAKAKQRAVERGSTAEFRVWNVFELQSLSMTFDTVLDSGMFQVFSDEERLLYVPSLASVLRSGGTYHLICCSEHERYARGPIYGPRAVTQAEIRATFARGWNVNYIRHSMFETINLHPNNRVNAWLASISKL